ncbi:MAG: hypothetical protein AB8E15_09355 [Bdellovibrionales bacterium]
MKKLTLLVAAASLVGGTAMAKHSGIHGSILGNFSYETSAKTADDTSAMGFGVERVRISGHHSFNDNWSAKLSLQTAQTSGVTGDAFLRKAYIKGKDVFTGGDHMKFGVFSNLYKATVYKNLNQRWHSEAMLQQLGSTYVELSEEHAGIRYGNMSGAFKYGIDLHNGQQTSLESGQADAAIGYALSLGYEMGMFGVDFFYNSNSESDDGTTEKASTQMALVLNYMSDMIKGQLEYISGDLDGRDATLTGFRLALQYALSEMNDIYFHYQSHPEDLETATTITSQIKLGYTWNLAKGLQNGVFYTMTDVSTDGADDPATLMWNWHAKF